MNDKSTRMVSRCPACGAQVGTHFVDRRDGVGLRRCVGCASLYLERVPVHIASLYADNYFALTDDAAKDNSETRIGYEASYESSYLDAEFYWAFRIADFVASQVQPAPRLRRCLDVGAATGRLLNAFSATGYETHGIEFSAPARAIARARGHSMTDAPAGTLPGHAGLFSVVTALEVIEHVEDLRAFFRGIRDVMCEGGVLVGFFPSADDRAFRSGPGYYWLNASFEHLVYPSESGIRAALEPCFGRNVHVATFPTWQGDDVIPFTVVVAVRGELSVETHRPLAELFRQLAYLNDRAWFDLDGPRGPGALGAAWDIAKAIPGGDDDSQIPYIAGLLCAKFGDFQVARYLRRDDPSPEGLDDLQLADLLMMAMHDGGIDWMREWLPRIGPRIPLPTIVAECRGLVERFDSEHPPSTSVATAEPTASAGVGVRVAAGPPLPTDPGSP